jgi:hypothetical protein
MRTFLAPLLLWSAGSLASLACAKQCSYVDMPQIIAHTGTPVGKEKMYDGGQIIALFHQPFTELQTTKTAH